jgi:hypothetical protein
MCAKYLTIYKRTLFQRVRSQESKGEGEGLADNLECLRECPIRSTFDLLDPKISRLVWKHAPSTKLDQLTYATKVGGRCARGALADHAKPIECVKIRVITTEKSRC